MINISDPHDCCGCSACVQACPKQCILFEEDERGFRYPSVNMELCVDCGLCEQVCTCLNQRNPQMPLKVYAAINPNEEIRMKSSSGGIFTMLAEKIIDEGGVVFGARFDANWEVVHDFSETKEGIQPFRGSKYVGSRIGDSYKQACEFLKTGRKVLFSGTSCQIAGLKKFLRKEYDNLLTLDVVCHGVPSALVWREYLKFIKHTDCVAFSDFSSITSINFRDKSTGWKKYSLVIRGSNSFEGNISTIPLSKVCDKIILDENLNNNLFMQLFRHNLCLRPSCFLCPAKEGRSCSDITIADYWGVTLFHPNWDDDKGTSLVLTYSTKGERAFAELDCNCINTTYENAIKGNSSIVKSAVECGASVLFWRCFEDSKFFQIQSLLNSLRPSPIKRIKMFPKSVINKMKIVVKQYFKN